MQDRFTLQCPTLECMTESMAQVQSLADALLVRILLYNALLYLHAVAYHALQLLQIRLVEVKADQFFPHCFCRNQTVFQHLCIARTDVFCIERLQELCIENNELRIVEHTYFVLQSAEVDACLSTYRCIYHSQQGGRNIDKVDTSLKSAGSKATQVGYHTAAQINHTGVA